MRRLDHIIGELDGIENDIPRPAARDARRAMDLLRQARERGQAEASVLLAASLVGLMLWALARGGWRLLPAGS